MMVTVNRWLLTSLVCTSGLPGRSWAFRLGIQLLGYDTLVNVGELTIIHILMMMVLVLVMVLVLMMAL